MKVEVKITDDGVEKTFSLDEEKPVDPNDAVNPILAIAKKYRLDLLGSWSRVCGEAVMVHCDERLMPAEMSILARMLTGEWGGGVPMKDFTGCIYRWVKLVQHYDFPKLPPLDLSLICSAVLAVWERVTMNVSPEGAIVLGGEPDYCPLYGPACKLWKIVKEGNETAPEPDCPKDEARIVLRRGKSVILDRGARELHPSQKGNEMNEVKVTVEWSTDAGLHPTPMTVHFAGEADPHEVIGAVTKSMGFSEPKTFKVGEDEFAHILCDQDDKVTLYLPNGEIRSFPTWREGLDYIANLDDEVKKGE